MSRDRRRRRRGHRHGLHRDRPRRGAAAHRRPGPRRPRQHPGARRRPGGQPSSVRARLRLPRRAPRDPAVDVVHVTSPNDLHLPQALGDPRGRPARRLREAARDDRGGVRASWSTLAAASGLVNAANFNIRYYPLNQHAREVVAAGELGEVRLVTGRYFQDWLLHDSDWNWRLEPDQRRRAPRGRRHRLALARPDGVRDGSARSSSVMADLATFIDGAPRADRAGRDLLDRAIATETVDAPDRAPRTPRRSSCASRTAPAARSASRQISAGRKNSLQYEIDGSDVAVGLGFRAARPALARPPRPPQRDPHPEPGPDGTVRTGCRGTTRVAMSRASPTRSQPISERSTRTSTAGRPISPSRAYPAFADGHDEMLVNDAIAPEARLGRWVDVGHATRH